MLSLENQIIICDQKEFLEEFYDVAIKFIEFTDYISEGQYSDDLKEEIVVIKNWNKKLK